MTAIRITEAANELKIKKGQAIALAEAGVLVYVNDGSTGKCKTVTLDSVWAAKKLDKEVLIGAIRKEAAKTQDAPAEVSKDNVSTEQKGATPDVVSLLVSMNSELRQMRGIICRHFGIYEQPLLKGIV